MSTQFGAEYIRAVEILAATAPAASALDIVLQGEECLGISPDGHYIHIRGRFARLVTRDEAARLYSDLPLVRCADGEYAP